MICTRRFCATPCSLFLAHPVAISLNLVAFIAGVVTPGVYHETTGATVHTVVNQRQNMAAYLSTNSGSRPAAVGHALHRRWSQPFISSNTGEQTASSKRAPVVPASRRRTGHFPIGQLKYMTPLWMFVVQLRGVVSLVLMHNFIGVIVRRR